MRTILTYGTYDLIHVGHINLLRRARELGDRLIVGLSTDEFNLGKDKRSIFSFPERRIILEAIEYVDVVIPEETWEQKRQDIADHDVDALVMGDDWEGKFDDLRTACEVIYVPRTAEISTTYFKNRIVLDSERDGRITVNYPGRSGDG